ncbi:MAG: sigma-70 family RNA polymerase sigma factor [Bradyrhizobiaceae bacterium]|nr:sigma-70 family RNA polymerase sigma factor [Bradyrhizobiaceae bacterium]
MTTEQQLQAEESAAEDERIIREVLAGNTNAFAQLERKYKKVVGFLIRKMVRDEEDAADLTQDTFMKAYNGLASFRFEFHFSKWLYKIASNRCIDYLRRKRFQATSLDQPLTTKDGGELTLEVPDTGAVADDLLLAKERAELLKEALAALPEKYRIVIKMRHEEELDYQEIADKLNHPLGTVKAHLFRARKLLYKALMRHGTHFEEYMSDDE